MPYDSSRISRLNTLFITCIFRYIQTNIIFNVLISLDFPGRNAALYHVNLQVSLWLFWNPLFMLCLANWYRTEDVWAIQWKGHQGRDAGTGGESQSAKVIFWSWPKKDLIWFRYTWVWWQESRRLGHNYVGTEMLLVGVVADTSGASGKVLKKFNVTLKDWRVDYTSDVKRDWKEHRKAMSLAGNPQDDGRDGWPWYWHGLSGDPFHPSSKACIGRWCALVNGFKGSRIPCSITLVHGTVLPA